MLIWNKDVDDDVIESFATNAFHFPVSHLLAFFPVTRTRFASCCFVAACNGMRKRVLDDHAESPPKLWQVAIRNEKLFLLHSTKYFFSVPQTTI